MEDGPILFPPQKEILKLGYLESKDNWLICTSTGSGKTLMGEWAMLQAIRVGKRAAYVAPLKAIVEEKIEDWHRKYPEVQIGLYTGDSVKNSAKPKDENLLLFTPEKFSSYVCRWKKNLSWIAELDVIVFDEFHLLGDTSRGASLEALLARIRRIHPFVRIIGLSATLSNAEEIAAWLRAQVFRSDWRPLPIERRITRFKKAEQKWELLLDEIQTTRAQGGKTLVFVNSRKRSETLAIKLCEHGIKADCNHAGLSRETRSSTQQAFRRGELEAVVSTSTLEMGVNLPARKVVIYDSYWFDGESFSPMPIRRYLQCIGRAGRPGLDTIGESVLFLPAWDRGKVDYLSTQSEPICSGLSSADALAKEIVTEVATRLSISEEHLKSNFGDLTLWHKQGGSTDMKDHVHHLVDAGLLKWSGDYYLSVTGLGRVAAQLNICPTSVKRLRSAYEIDFNSTEFDLLLIGCLLREASPKLGFNFEEIDPMADLLLQVESQILDTPVSILKRTGLVLSAKALLSAIKCSSLLYQYIQGTSMEILAQVYDCYSADLKILTQNVTWVLEAAKRVFSILQKKDQSENTDQPGSKPATWNPVATLQDLQLMLQYGVPRNSLNLVRIKGIGAQRARSLIAAGIRTPQQLTTENTSQLCDILRMSEKTLHPILLSAMEFNNQPDHVSETYGGILPAALTGGRRPSTFLPSVWASRIDPYRLRRSLELRVDHVSQECIRISGGAEPHTVKVGWISSKLRSYQCDCVDFAKGQANCKHILRARLELRDDAELLDLLNLLKTDHDRPLRYSLGELWMQIGRDYDVYFDRSVDYTGQKFLDRARAKERWKR